MEFRGEVRVKNRVDVLEVSASRVFVETVWLRVWPVEVSTSRCRLKVVKVLSRNKHIPLAH